MKAGPGVGNCTCGSAAPAFMLTDAKPVASPADAMLTKPVEVSTPSLKLSKLIDSGGGSMLRVNAPAVAALIAMERVEILPVFMKLC